MMSRMNGKKTHTHTQHILSLRIFTSRPGSGLRIFIEMQIQYSYYYSTLLYSSSIIRLYPQNPVFKIVHDKSVKDYLPMYNGNVQQNPLCVESCVIKKFSMSLLFSSTIFDPDANSVLLRAHFCPAADSMRRNPLYNFLSRCKFSTPTSTLLYSSINRLYPQNPVFKIVHDESVKVYLPMYNGNVQQNPLCVESCVTKKFSMSPLFSSTIFQGFTWTAGGTV